jgi:hypothetical protein
MAGITLKELIEQADERAGLILNDMGRAGISRNEFRSDVRDYTLAKFLLEPGEASGDDIFELAEASIEKLLAMNDKSILLAVGSTTCTNQSSTDIKKVLLSLALQQGMGIKLEPDESAACETTQELADALYDRTQG